MQRFPLCALAFLLAATPLGAQAIDPKLDALITRLHRGDESARNELSSFAWGGATDAAQGRVTAAQSRALGAAALALAEPISAPEAHMDQREFTWRPIAVRNFRQALSSDSSDLFSLTQLERITAYPYLWWDPEKELALFRSVAARSPRMPPSLAAVRVGLELEKGSIDSAAKVLSRIGAGELSAALHGHLAAEVAFAKGEDSLGRQLYLSGAMAIADSADAERYSRELVFIAKPEDVEAWHALSNGRGVRGEWLNAFWTRLDLRDARLPGSRLPEQFRRWRHALSSYRWETDGSTAMGVYVPRSAANELNFDDIAFPGDASSIGSDNRYLPQSRILDDRGLLVLRLGIPDREANLSGIGATSEQNLLWETPDGPLIVGFSRPATDDPLHMVLYRFGMLARNQPMGDLVTVCQIDKRLCPLAGQIVIANMGPQLGLRPGGANRAGTLRLDYKRMRSIAEHSESNRETYADSLGAIVQAYGIANGGALVVVAVPVRNLTSSDKEREARRAFAARVRVIVGDSSAGRIVATLDTMRVWRASAAVGKDAYLSAYFTVPAPVGSWTVNVVVGDSSHRAGTGARFARLPMVPFDGKALQISDPILGLEASGLSWHHGSDVIQLNPLGAWRREDVGILTYDVDGLIAGRAYQTRLELWKADPKAKAASNIVAFAMNATAPRQAMRRELSLRELPPGEYRLLIRIADPVTKDEVVRERRLQVRKQ